MKNSSITAVLLVSFVLCCGGVSLSGASNAVQALGQNAAQLDSINAAQVEKKLLEQKEVLPRSEFVIAPSKAPQGLTRIPKGGQNVTLFLDKVKFSGGTVFSDSQLEEWASSYTKRKITLVEFYALADQITRHYKDAGYLFSRAVVPPQKIGAQGQGTIQLVEGYVDEVVYEGDVDAFSDRARSLADKIKASRPLTAPDLERYLLLLKEIPGLNVEAVLKPSPTQPHAASLVLVAKKKMIEGAASISNVGSKYTGPILSNIMVGLNTWWDDQWTFGYTTTGNPREMKSGQLGYSKVLNAEGTKCDVVAAITETRPGEALAALEITGATRSVKIGVRHPLVRSRARTIIVGGSFAAKNVKSGFLGNIIRSEDRLRVAGLNVSWDQADAWRGVNLVRAEWAHGLKIFRATSSSDKNKSRASGRPDFSKITLDYSRIQGLVGKTSLLFALESQYAFNPLLSPERFSYGGTALSRGYTDSPLTGDSGVREKIELRYGETIENPVFLSSYQAYGFVGMGTVWNKKVSASERKRTSASEGGLGARFGMAKNLQASFEYVRPFKRYIEGIKNPPSWFATLTCGF